MTSLARTAAMRTQWAAMASRSTYPHRARPSGWRGGSGLGSGEFLGAGGYRYQHPGIGGGAMWSRSQRHLFSWWNRKDDESGGDDKKKEKEEGGGAAVADDGAAAGDAAGGGKRKGKSKKPKPVAAAVVAGQGEVGASSEGKGEDKEDSDGGDKGGETDSKPIIRNRTDQPVTMGVGEQAPRYPRLIGLPVTRRPLFPGTVHPYTVTNPAVLEAVIKSKEEGHPYLGVFLRKDSGNGLTGEEDDEHMHGRGLSGLSGVAGGHGHGGGMDGVGDDVRANANGVYYPEIITDIDDIYRVGTFAQVHQIMQLGGKGVQLLLLAHRRLSIKDVISKGPPLEVEVEHWNRGEPYEANSDVVKAYCQEIVATIRDVVKMNPLLREHMTFFSQRIDIHDPFKLADFAAAMTTADGHVLQKVLEEMKVEERLRMALELVVKERELSRVQQEIQRQVEEKMSKQQRTYFLQEQLKSIKKELGMEKDDKDTLLTKYRARVAKLQAGLSKEAETAINEELEKLASLEKNSPEFNTTRNYLDWLTQLPWGKLSEENYNLKKAKETLDADHYGLEDVKKRILEFIAVGKLRQGTADGAGLGKIICFVGPPGVGKTSVGTSIARALNREFYRFSVGGLTDVAEIKGHRRTYVGAMPGKLIQCLKATGSSNPLVMIDEVDKMGKGYQGDPASALLEVLDPSQNTAFVDHYLDIPVDLSKVLFICTANVLDTVPGPLLDRMEVIRLSGYDLPEKMAISKQYLVPKAKREHGLTEGKEGVPESLGVSSAALDQLIRWYCREAGVRNLEKHIQKIHRKLALEVVEVQEGTASVELATRESWEVQPETLPHYVGKPLFTSDRIYEHDLPAGVVMGLAWTAMGGSCLYIETAAVFRNTATSVSEAARKLKKKGRGSKGGVVIDPIVIEHDDDVDDDGDDDDEEGEKRDVGAGRGSGGGGAIKCTGQMGSVMLESVSIAHTYARNELHKIEPGNSFFDDLNIHLHVPEGATPKDGPSAGVTVVTALLSLATSKPVRADVAMTGEMSLNGHVLPVGGIKEKTIAARRAGITCLIFPKGNQRDFEELPEYLKEGLNVHYASIYEDVRKVAFAEEVDTHPHTPPPLSASQ